MEVLDLKQMAQDAIALHQQGKLDQAEAAYLRILEADPALFGPRYYLGLIRMQQGRFEEACTLLGQASTVYPDDLSCLMKYGMALRGAGHSLAGTLTGRRSEPRIVMVEDHTTDVPPAEHMLVVRNDDRPGVIGVVGTGLGLMLGGTVGIGLDRYHLIALDPTIYFIDHLPVRMQALDVALISLLGVAVATLATVYPALQASRLYPLEAIRSE